LNIIWKIIKHKIVNTRDNSNKSRVKLNVSKLKLINRYSGLTERKIKKIINERKVLVMGFREILSSIIPTNKSEKITNNVNIELTSFERPKELSKLKLLKKISIIKIMNRFIK
jgi:hypothetical protein